MQKHCNICNETKPTSEFHKCNRASDGLQYRCKTCAIRLVREARLKRLERDPTHDKRIKQAWYKKNREVSIARAKRYREEHPEWAKKVNKYANKSEWSKSWRERNPERAKAASRLSSRVRLLRKYGLTEESYQALKAQQDSRCAICSCSVVPDDGYGGLHDGFHIDHCHVINRVRGLLCKHCNVGIGMLKDSEVILQAAISYLLRAKQKHKTLYLALEEENNI